MYHCFCKVSSAGDEGLRLLKIWLLGERTWGKGGSGGREWRPRGASICPWLPGPQRSADFVTLPPGAREEVGAPGSSFKTPVQEEGPEGRLSEEAETDRPEGAQ